MRHLPVDSRRRSHGRAAVVRPIPFAFLVTPGKGTAVVAGALARRPGIGGHSWVFLQYLLGLRRLGWDVLFLDRLEPEACVDAEGAACRPEQSWNVRYLAQVMEQFGLSGRWSLACGGQTIGLPRGDVLRRAAHAGFVLNVMGYLTDPEILGRIRRRVFLDIDPGFGQMWRVLGQADLFQGHDAFVTVGANIGGTGCTVPTCDLEWIPTTPPVVLEHWPPQPASNRGAFTSVATWRGPFGPVELDGRKYGLRAHEFRTFLPLPRLTGYPFEVALAIDAADTADRTALTDGGWAIVDPAQAACDPCAYRDYIQSSRAEFMAAKGMYVRSRCGWVSDRTVCYLASGRPALVQDTGLCHRYRTGEGLVVFTTLDEAAAAAKDIMLDYPRHSRAARAIAEQHFDSDIVLRSLLERLGVH